MSLKNNRVIRRNLPTDGEEWEGVIFEKDGSATVKDNPLYSWVQKATGGQPVPVYNDGVPHRAGQRVRVGKDRKDRRLRVLRGVYHAGGDQSVNPNVGPHGQSHFANALDPAPISAYQEVELGLTVVSGMTVRISGGWVVINSQPAYVNTQTIDLTSHVPVSGARWALILADSAGALSVQDGDALSNYADVTRQNLPVVNVGYTALWAVRLYAGQTAVSKAWASIDYYPLWCAPQNFATGSGLPTSDNIYRYNAAGLIVERYDVSADGLTAALADAVSGDLIYMPAPSMTGDFTVPDGVTVQGLNRDRTIITGSLTCIGNAIFRSLRINVYSTSSSNKKGIVAQGNNETVTIIDCFIDVVTTSTGQAWGISLEEDNALVQMRDSFMGGTGANAWLMMFDAAKSDQFIGARFNNFAGSQVCSGEDGDHIFETCDNQFDAGANTYGTPVTDADRAAYNHTHPADVESFIDLDDVPSDYLSAGGKFVKVREDQSGLEFADSTSSSVVPPATRVFMNRTFV